MAKSKSREKLIREAERFAAGCSRSRLELRLVDEIRRLEDRLDKVVDVLEQPLDTTQVLDSHAGRALWGASLAAEASRVLGAERNW